MIRTLVFPFIAAILVSTPVFAQATRPSNLAPAEGMNVMLITMGPGGAIWEKFGHNAIIVSDPGRDINVAYNYGVFDFDDKDFLIRFIQGDMRYWMEPVPAVEMVLPYVQQGRIVRRQDMDFTQDQAQKLYAALEANAEPENKYYHYNYYTDNCSTRIRDMIDAAFDGEVKRQLSQIRTGRTYRWHSGIGLSSEPLLAMGVNFTGSAFIDRELTAWDECFVPAYLMEHLRKVRIDGRPIVVPQRDIDISDFQLPEFGLPPAPPRYWRAMLGVGVAIGGILILAGFAAARSILGRWFAAIVWGIWGLVAGLGGVFLLFMWFLTRHVAAYGNENLHQTSPIALALVILGPMAAFARGRRAAWWIVVAMAAMSAGGLVIKILPMFRQDNWDILALTIPANLGLLVGLSLRNRPPAAAAAPPTNEDRKKQAMNKTQPSLTSIALLAMCLLAVGCATQPPEPDTSQNAADERQKVLKTVPPSPKPPPAPMATPTKIDPALRDKAKAEILVASRSGNAVIRANAMEAAQNSLGAEGAQVILAGLKDEKPVVRFAASMAAGMTRLDTARPILEGLADDRDETVQIGARFALHRLGDTRRSHDLEKFAVASQPRIRATTVVALGLLGERSALNILRPMQNDYDPAVRIQVAEAMWRLGDEKGMESLIGATISQSPDDQIIATQALSSTNDKRMAPYFRGKLTTVYDEVNLSAARALGMVGSDEGYGVAQKGAKSSDPRHRHLAALAFGAIGRPDAQEMLSELLGDSEPSVRLAAAMAVLQLRE